MEFITLDVDKAGRPGVDLIAFPPIGCSALVIGVTTGVIDSDLEKLASTVKNLRAWLGNLRRKIEIVPIVITSLAAEINPRSAEYARKHGIVALCSTDVDQLVQWASTGRTYRRLLAKIKER